MTPINELKEVYLALGVGGLSFIILIMILGYLLKQVLPVLNNIVQMMEVLKEVLQNNNKAIDEMAKSNQNVATALSLLERSMTTVETKVDKVMISNEEIEKSIIQVKERINRR